MRSLPTFVLGLAAVPGLAGCSGSKPSPADICSAQDTYDGVTRIISHDLIGQASTFRDTAWGRSGNLDATVRMLDPARLAPIISFKSPTVASYEEGTGKVTCNALLTVQGRANSLDSLQKDAADVNSYDRNHITFNIVYTAEPSADKSSGDMVYGLTKTKDLYNSFAVIVSDGVEAEHPTAAGGVGASSTSPAETEKDDAVGDAADPAPPEQPSPPRRQSSDTDIGKRYDTVRRDVLNAGFTPVPRDSDGSCDYAPQCRYPETENCSETGEQDCEYRFSKGGLLLRILAKGETDENDQGGQIVYRIQTHS